jgi:hypothetical protein
MRSAGETRQRIAVVGLVVAVPLAVLGLVLPFHDYAGMGAALDDTVTSDSLLVSTLLVVPTAVVALIPVLARPRRLPLALALLVLGLAVFNLIRVVSYFWWRSDLVVCGGGC